MSGADVGQLGLALEGGLAGHTATSAPGCASAASQSPATAEEFATAAVVRELPRSDLDTDARLPDLEHPVTTYLNSLAQSSRRPQLSALEWIARRATQLCTAETMPWHRLRRPQVLKIRGLLEEHYQATTTNRMLSALRSVLRECWQAQLINHKDYQAAINIPTVRGEPEPRGRHLSAGEL